MIITRSVPLSLTDYTLINQNSVGDAMNYFCTIQRGLTYALVYTDAADDVITSETPFHTVGVRDSLFSNLLSTPLFAWAKATQTTQGILGAGADPVTVLSITLLDA